MEDHLKLKKNTTNQSFGIYGKTVTVEARKSLHLPDRFNQSGAALHHDIRKNVEDTLPGLSRNRQKQERKKIDEDELVKYMSNLPSYLVKGKNHQESALNVGVLDWDHLKKWQCNRKQMPQGSSRYSLSSINSSSAFSTEGSTLYYSRDQSCSHGYPKTHRPSLQFHLMSSPVESRSQVIKPFRDSVAKCQPDRSSQANIRSEQVQFIKAVKPFPENEPEMKLGPFQQNDFDPKNQECKTLVSGLNYESLQCKKMEAQSEDCELVKKAGKLEENKARVGKRDHTQKKVGRDHSHVNNPRGSRFSNQEAVSSQRAEEAGRRSFSDMLVENFPPVVSSDVPHSCPLPNEMDRLSDLRCSVVAERMTLLPRSIHNPIKLGVDASQGGISKERKPIEAKMSSIPKMPFVGSDLKPSKTAAEKARSTSPFRRLGMGMSKITKNFNSRDGSSKPHLSSTSNSANSSLKNATPTFCQGKPCGDTQYANERAKSSPLRRLFDPLLKPKAPNSHHSSEPLKRSLISADNACKSSDGKFTGATEPMVVKFDATGCRTIGASDPTKDRKCRPSAFQALLRVAFKNGQPLFTFAVDNERDILAATMKKLSPSAEDDYNCIYNFFAFQEVKKKNGRWMNQAGKGKGHDYAQNVVAQLKVSGSQISNSSGLNSIEQSLAREFVLFSVALHHSEQQILDFRPNHELAAIVLKVVKVIGKTKIRNVDQSDKCYALPARRLNSTPTDEQNQPNIGCQSHMSTTVILPSGVHSLPNKGGPSSLIQRWKSGGSCDCGGWDLGCKLRILKTRNPVSNLCSKKTDVFEMISQGGEEQNQPVFSLAPFRDGIYSVDFNSSLSALQAFSLCIAVLDGKKLCEMEESSNLLEEAPLLETVLAPQSEGIKAPNETDGEIPARYVSYPPLSPVGRV